MDTVCHGKQWDVLLVQKGGRVQGALPYLIGQKLGIKYILQPRLTPFSGPWLDSGLSRDDQRSVLSDLCEQLGQLHVGLYGQCWSPTVQDHLPFHWAGYKETTRYTYRFNSLADPDALMAAAARGRRRNLQAVQEALSTIDQQFPADQFVQLHRQYFERHKGQELVPGDVLLRVCQAALGKHQALLWALRDKQQQPVVASLVVFDSHCAYALASAIGSDAPANCKTYLVWQLVKHLSVLTQAFDFEGSMEQGTEQFYRSFGAVQTPYHYVFRSRIPLGNRLLGV